jgi:hypothetical protein
MSGVGPVGWAGPAAVSEEGRSGGVGPVGWAGPAAVSEEGRSGGGP